MARPSNEYPNVFFAHIFVEGNWGGGVLCSQIVCKQIWDENKKRKKEKKYSMILSMCVVSLWDWKQIYVVFGISSLKVTLNAELCSAQ